MSTLASHHAPSQRDEGSAAVGKESIELRTRLESVYFRRTELSAAELARFEAFREVGNTYESSAQPNWDESGANPVSHTVFTEALRFLRLLPGWVEMPEVGAEPDGSLSFEWYLKPDGHSLSRLSALRRSNTRESSCLWQVHTELRFLETESHVRYWKTLGGFSAR